jgi:RimJ/RimL family protein N-acetyltransferase
MNRPTASPATTGTDRGKAGDTAVDGDAAQTAPTPQPTPVKPGGAGAAAGGHSPTRLTAHLQHLRRGGQYAAARALLARALARIPDPALRQIAWQHEPFWWAPLQGPRVRLVRRGPDDIELVRRCWSDAEFMRHFHRGAAPLPADDTALADLLRNEQAAIPSESQALHWTIEVGGTKAGFVSIVNISLRQRRAECLIGIQGDHGPFAYAEAAHLMFGFLAERARIERLTAHYYPENQRAIDSAVALGFEVEGTLRGYLREPDGRRSDLVVAGMVLDPAFFERTARLRQRVLG